jgi:metal-responsive CopG/Arc/MetJ family transcriptional regulator
MLIKWSHLIGSHGNILGESVKIVTFKLDDKLLERIDRVAQREGVSRSEVIREAIINYLNGNLRRGKRNSIRVKYVVLT